MRLRTALAAVAAAAVLSACTPEQNAEFKAINGLRGTDGHASLPWRESVGDIAQAYAEKLASDGFPLAHNPHLAEALNGTDLSWLAAGENVGCGASAAAVFTGYVQSPPHLHNMESDAWDVVGTGVATAGRKTCTVQVFVDLG